MPTRTPSPATPDGPRRPARARTPRAAPRRLADVTAVLVAHDGAQWLPDVIAALAASTVTPTRVLCVDTGSRDGSADLLAEALTASAPDDGRPDDRNDPHGVLQLPVDTGFGAAVATALAQDTEPATRWVWLLHDDVAVEPDTLERLLEHAESSPSAALLGPKVRDWNDPRYLVEVGITTDAAGHRETGLERREYDQGQHDAVRDVLAVGTAAALVRRDAWDQVGGLDPELAVFRDDLDLGWKLNAAGHRVVVVPDARVRHARAATTGHRSLDAEPGRATGVDRRNALFVLLAHASAVRLLGLLPRLLLATVLRSLVLLLSRQVAAAGDEWRAVVSVLGRPRRLHAARRQRASTRSVAQRSLRPLFASRGVRIRARLAAVGDWLASGNAAPSALGGLGDPGPDGDDEFADGDLGGDGLLRRLLVRPGVLLVAGLTVVALVAERSLLLGGRLSGGALLPAPAGASALWRSYLGAWHDVGVGTGQASPPGTAALAVLSTLMLGSPTAAVSALLLLSVPLAGLTAYLAACRLVRHTVLRLWVAVTWAVLPVATGTIAAGRLDAAAAQIALPLLVLAAGRLLTDDPRVEGWWRAWALGLALGVTCAFAPLLWPLSAAVLLAGAGANLVLTGGRRRALAAVIVAVVPAGVLFPWSFQALAHPSMFVGRVQVAEAGIPGWKLLLLWPGGPGVPVALLTVGVLLAGFAGTLRLAFRGLALACWGVAFVGYAGALLLSRVTVDGGPVWPGPALQVAALGLLTAALVAANGARTRLARTSFGARQLLAAVVALLAAAAPVACAGAWLVRGADDPLRRSDVATLPAFARAELEASPGLRVLVLAARADGTLGYALGTGDGLGLEDAALRSSDAQRAMLSALVADLASPRGSAAAEALATRAVRYVAVRHPDASLVATLDAQAGLVRRTAGDTDMWQVVAPSARLSVLPPATAARALAGDPAPTADLLRAGRPQPLPAGREGARATLQAGPAGRLLVLADAADPRWRATVDGQSLKRVTAWGWAQAFVLPEDGGALQVSYDQTRRHLGLVGQAIGLTAVLVLSAPGARRRRGLEDDVDVEDEDMAGPPQRRLPVAAL